MNKEAIINIIASIVLGFIGLWIMVNPGIGIDFIRLYLPIILIVFGVCLVAYYYLRKEKSFLTILEAALFFIVGILLIASFHFSLAFVNIIILVWLALEGILGLVHTGKYIKHKIKLWFVVLLYSLVALGIVAYITYSIVQGAQVTIVQLAGIFMFVKGIVGFLDAFYYRKLYMKDKNKV